MTTYTVPRHEAPVSSITRVTPQAAARTPAKFTSPLAEEEADTQARLLKAFSDPTRLRILSLLSRHEGDVCVFEIVAAFRLEQPTISHHLRILRDAGLVHCRKNGLWAYYYVSSPALAQAQRIIDALYPEQHAAAEH